MGRFVDRTGLRYGRLTVLAVDPAASSAAAGRRLRWLCRCDCGLESSVTGHALTRGDTTSCGCVKQEALRNRRTHGMTRTPTYRSWQAAKDRCGNPHNEKFPEYGGRGIRMCDRWRNSFDAFLVDMGERPDGTTIDRIDPNGHYEPCNCRWATAAIQAVNQRDVVLHEWAGKRLTVKDIAKHEGVPRTSLNKALRRLGDIHQALAHVRSRLGRSGIDNLRA
jgi:hypothetical protein